MTEKCCEIFFADYLTTILGDAWPTFCQLFLYLLTKIPKSQKYTGCPKEKVRPDKSL